MNSPNRPQVFIEKIMPVELLNQQVYYENGGNPFKGLHRWYSRKPLSFSRASVLGSLLPADISMDDFEYLLGLERRQYRSKEVKLYQTPPSPERIKQVHDLCEKVWGKRTPTVLDAFAGGGSIPFEAARYGLNVLASDLNPVAVVTMKAAMEYPLKFGPDLQQDIDKWVKWVGDEAEKRLAEFFPSLPGETVQNYLWAHTVVCPSCESVVPLSPNWWLSKTSNYAGKGQARKVTSDWYAVKPIPNPEKKRVDFELVKGKKGKGTTIIYRRGGGIDRASGRQDACPTGLNLDAVAQASSLQTLQDNSVDGSRQDACPTGLNLDAVAQASSLQTLKNPQLKITKRRLPHWELNGSVYFITFNTWEKLELSEAARQVVLDACRFFDGQRYKIFSLVVMPDHVHWLIQPLQKSEDEFWSLSSIMHSIKSYSAKQIPQVMKHLGTVWQIEWHDRIIRDQQEFENTWEYIRLNPVKANLCEHPENYAFLWQLTNPVGQASSLPSMPYSLVDSSRQDACPTDSDPNPVAQASSLQTIEEEYDPDTTTTISRGVGKCPNCGSVIEDETIKAYAQSTGLGHQLYAVAYRQGSSSLEFRLPTQPDYEAFQKADKFLFENKNDWKLSGLIPSQEIPSNTHRGPDMYLYGIYYWYQMFNARQILTLVTYVEIINEVKLKLQTE